jgi:hypothetical protein
MPMDPFSTLLSSFGPKMRVFFGLSIRSQVEGPETAPRYRLEAVGGQVDERRHPTTSDDGTAVPPLVVVAVRTTMPYAAYRSDD